MEIVIEIPDKIFNSLADVQFGGYISEWIFDAVKNGTPLPKGHGDLIDFQDLKNKYLLGGYIEMSSYDINNVPTIIEADKE